MSEIMTSESKVISGFRAIISSKELNKPFIVIVNTKDENSTKAQDVKKCITSLIKKELIYLDRTFCVTSVVKSIYESPFKFIIIFLVMLFICPTNYLASENTTNVESIQIESSLFVGDLNFKNINLL